MSANDIKVIKAPGSRRKRRVAAGTPIAIERGEPLKKGGTGNNFAVLLETGDPTVGSTIQPMLGIAAKDSTETAALDGRVEYVSLIPGQTVLRGRATTVANIDTDAKLAALEGDYVAFDLTGAVWTIDEDEGDDPNVHGLEILGGDITRGTLDVLVHALATEAAPLTGQTMD